MPSKFHVELASEGIYYRCGVYKSKCRKIPLYITKRMVTFRYNVDNYLRTIENYPLNILNICKLSQRVRYHILSYY